MSTEVLISYAAGTKDMLEVCLSSIYRHAPGEEMSVRVLAGDDASFKEASSVAAGRLVRVSRYDVSGARSSSGRHARMLDAAVAETKRDEVLTLDSDCFPVVDGWLEKLHAVDADVKGILWPWVPPPDSVGLNTIERRLRRQHCWNNTQVACQLMPVAMIRGMGLKFADPEGDDTGFGMMDKVHAAGLKVGGFMPTRCALPDDKRFCAEMNRHVCVVFGDVMYHHGGASREMVGEFHVDKGLFGKAREMVFNKMGAEWILEPGNHHAYDMKQEEDVAQFKMAMVYRDAVRFLQGNRAMFGGGWT